MPRRQPTSQFDPYRHRRERRQAISRGEWFQRGAMVMQGSADDSLRSIPAIVASETPVPIYDRQTDQIIDEVLLSSGAQLPDWAPMLRSHETYDLVHSTLGSVTQARRNGSNIEALLSFAQPVGDGDDVQKVWTRVRDGHLRGVSVGGRRLTYQDIPAGEMGTVAGRRWVAARRPLRVTMSWVLREASIVIFAADSTARTG